MLIPLLVVYLVLAACGVRGAIPDDADHPLMWIVGLSAAWFLLSAGAWMARGATRRWERRLDRHDKE